MTTPVSRDECLITTPLSFYDAFHTVSGVPAFLLPPVAADTDRTARDDPESFLTQPLLVTCCAFDASSQRLASGHYDGSVYVWDVDHGTLLKYSPQLHDAPICAISFSSESADAVLTADRTGRCTGWFLDASSNGRVLSMDCIPEWSDGVEAETRFRVVPQAPRFFDQGRLVVFPAMVCSPEPTMQFAVIETASLPRLGDKVLLSVDVDSEDVVTRMEMSPNGRGKGLLAGFTDSRVEEGFTVLWPDFTQDHTFRVHLQNGTLGSWAPDDSRVVTWTVPEEPFPQDNEGGCAFLWDVDQLRAQLRNPGEKLLQEDDPLKPVVLRNPFGKNVLWCRFVLDEENKSRLVMCVIRSTARLLFWDVDSHIITHVIPTGISTNDMILGSRECWKKCWVDGKFMKGLDPMRVTADMQWMGAVSGHQNRAVIWDAAQGVELLNIALPQALSDAVGVGVDLMMSSTPGKFAIIGYQRILVFCPPIASHKTSLPEHQMVELDYVDAFDTPDRTMKIAFSADGEVLAVLHVGSPSLHLFQLNSPLYLTVTEKKEGEFSVSYGDFLDFALASDFRFSVGYSALLVTLTASRKMLVWECRPDSANVVGVIHSDDKEGIRAMGLTPGNRAIVTCESSGDLIWYPLHDRMKPETPSTSRAAHELLPLLESGSTDDLAETTTWRGMKSIFNSLKIPLRRAKSDFYGSGDPQSTLRYSSHGFERQKAQGSHDCRFSADGTRAVLMPDHEKAFLWDLEMRTCIREIETYNGRQLVPVGPVQYERSLSIASSMIQRIHSEPEILSHVDPSFRATHRTEEWLERNMLVMSEHEDVFLLPGSGSLGPQDGQRNELVNQIFKERRNGECHSLLVVNANRPESTQRLTGYKLNPTKGMAISSDGRFVACVAKGNAGSLAKGKAGSKVLVWSCYAVDALLPSFHALKLKNATQSKQRVIEHLRPLLQRFGVNLLNYIHPCGSSLLLEAVDEVNDEILDVALHYSARHSFKVSLEGAEKHGMNAVQLALKRRSPEIASKMMKYLLERVTYEAQMARILKECLVPMNKSYPKIFNKMLHNPNLFCTISDLRVPEVLLGQHRFLESTSDLLYATEEAAEKIWAVRQIEDGLADADPITTRAHSKVLPFPNACQIGSGGLLRDMLVYGASDVCFASFAIKAIVTHKWRKYAGRLLLYEFGQYCLLLLCFTIYSFLMCYQETYNTISRSGNEETRWSTAIAFGLSWILTVPNVVKELVQASFYWSDYGWDGIHYWLKSAWNWMELLCYGTIVVVIPICQFWLLNEGRHTIILSAIVALESILLWSKMLYFAQPFRQTGPLVIIVSAIARDILPFLFLAACVMFGFAVAFLVLYRHVRIPEGHSSPQEESESDEAILASYGNFGRTLFSVVGYMFGDFESDVLFEAPSEAIAILLFMLYMIIITIILLNMLIAIMGDSFNRIKSCEEMQFIKARAVAIDDIEAMLFPQKKRQLQEHLKTYLHVALPKYRSQKVMNVFKRRGRDGKGGSRTSVKKMTDLLKALIERENAPSRPERRAPERSGGEMEDMAAISVASVGGSGESDSSSSLDAEELEELDGLSSLAFDE